MPHKKVLQIFKFIKALNELKYPISKNMSIHDWVLYVNDIPAHSTISIGKPFNNDGLNTEHEDYILKVVRPILTNCPQIPEELVKWIDGNWNNPNENIEVIESLSEYNPLDL